MGVSNDESRWTDNRQPLDSATREFSSAFEQILEETVSRDEAITNNEGTDTSGTESAPAQEGKRENWYDGTVEQLHMAISNEMHNSSSSENESLTQLMEPEGDADSSQMNIDNQQSTSNDNANSEAPPNQNIKKEASSEHNDNDLSSDAATSEALISERPTTE